jgi:hypothetical protein
MKKLVSILLAATLSVGLLSVNGSVAHADGRGRGAAFGLGVFTGIAALGIMSAAERDAYYRDHCHPGPERCRWVPRRCFFDEEVGERVCHGGRNECYRERMCD